MSAPVKCNRNKTYKKRSYLKTNVKFQKCILNVTQHYFLKMKLKQPIQNFQAIHSIFYHTAQLIQYNH